MKYVDFLLEISRPSSTGAYTIVATTSDGRAVEALQHFPFVGTSRELQLTKLENALLLSGGPTRRSSAKPHSEVQEFGAALFNFLMPAEIATNYRLAKKTAQNDKAGVRLRLQVRDPDMASIPWEYLYDEAVDDYVSLSPATPLVRYLDADHPIEVLKVGLPLRVLVMMAEPVDLDGLNVGRERRRLERALADLKARGLVELEFLEHTTFAKLQQQAAKDWHVLHFIGHGGFDAKADETGAGYLSLEKEDGTEHAVTAKDLASRVLGLHKPQLFVLNSCEGATGSQSDVFASSAATLMKCGIPAVVAMQHEITGDAAEAFAQGFYGNLAESGAVDFAVTHARSLIASNANYSIEWGTPVLFLRSPTGKLFDIGGDTPASVASVTLNPPEVPPLRVGDSYTLGARPLDGDGAPLYRGGIHWESDNPNVASIAFHDSHGVISAVASGKTVVHAVCDGQEARATVLVRRPQVVPPIALWGLVGLLLTAAVAWWIIRSGSNSDGQVEPAPSLDSPSAEVVPLPPVLTFQAVGPIAVGRSGTFSATLDQTTAVGAIWTSDRGDVLRVESDGTYEALAAGAALVTVTLGGQASSQRIQVTTRGSPPLPPVAARIELAAIPPSIEVGGSFTVEATVFGTDGNVMPGVSSGLQWSVTTGPARVTGSGTQATVTGSGEGPAQISISLGGLSTSKSFAVVGAERVAGRIELSRVPDSLEVGESTEVQATVFDTRGDRMTEIQVHWSGDRQIDVVGSGGRATVTGANAGAARLSLGTGDLTESRDIVVVSVEDLLRRVIANYATGLSTQTRAVIDASYQGYTDEQFVLLQSDARGVTFSITPNGDPERAGSAWRWCVDDRPSERLPPARYKLVFERRGEGWKITGKIPC